MTEGKITATVIDKDIIDGSQVVSRATARLYSPNSKYPDQLSPTYGVDACELADGRKVYQCVHPDPPECTYWHLKGESVRSHLRVHTLKTEKEKRAALVKQLEELKKREAQRQANYTNGAKKAWRTRRERYGDTGTSEDGNEEPTMTNDELRRKISNLQTIMEGMAEGLQRVNTVVSNIGETMKTTVASLDEVAEAATAPNAELVEKAASWDAIQGLLNPGGKKS